MPKQVWLLFCLFLLEKQEFYAKATTQFQTITKAISTADSAYETHSIAYSGI